MNLSLMTGLQKSLSTRLFQRLGTYQSCIDGDIVSNADEIKVGYLSLEVDFNALANSGTTKTVI